MIPWVDWSPAALSWIEALFIEYLFPTNDEPIAGAAPGLIELVFICLMFITGLAATALRTNKDCWVFP